MSTHRVRIGLHDIDVPDGVRADLAEEIAERLTLRLKEIEANAQRFNSITFALQLAFESALKVRQQAEQHASEKERDDAELMKSLRALNELIEDALAPRDKPKNTTPFRRA